ncbi:MAG: NAD(P)H-hydrate epimerase [Mariniblastus sp.]
MLTREQCQQADQAAIHRFCIPSLVLMENAGRTCAEHLILQSHCQSRNRQAVVILCGPGNNGGDGFVIARHLYNAGITTKVVLFQRVEKYAGDAKLNLDSISHLRMPVVEADIDWTDEKLLRVLGRVKRLATTWVVDGLLGTGASGEPRGMMWKAIDSANRMEVRRFAVDIPTGLDCNTGQPANSTFKADLTCTFIANKIGFGVSEARKYLGQVLVAGIGAPDEIMQG